jgi:hypothetical protein
MYAPKNLGSRHCFRCSHPLTDAASLNEGIGPYCRLLDNALLARLIPSDMEKVLAAYSSVDVLELTPETMETFQNLEAALRASDAGSREDWRIEVKRIEWILSHNQNRHNIKALCGIVLGLGYVGIVALWMGEAATGLASVFPMAEGRLGVSGPQNKAARMAFKRIHGYQFHPVGPSVSKACWSFPAHEFNAFRMAVIKHYPHFEGLVETIEAAEIHLAELQVLAEAQVAADAAKLAKMGPLAPYVTSPVAPPTPPKTLPSGEPIISITEVGDTLKVKTPFRMSYVAELRKLDKALLPRKWNPAESVWEFPAAFKAQVEALVEKHYGKVP